MPDHREIQHTTSDGIVMRLRPHRYLDREIYLGGHNFEPETTQLVRHLVKPGFRVLDVGGNIGYFTLIFAKLAGPTGCVWACEPTNNFRTDLLHNLSLNPDIQCVKVLPLGLSDEPATLEIGIGECSATLHTSNNDDPLPKHELIQLIPFDVVKQQENIPDLDFVKVDIDGHEPNFIKGASSIWKQKMLPVLVMEFAQLSLDAAGGNDVRNLKQMLEERGYVLYSEKTLLPFESRAKFLKECGNYTYSANVWGIPPQLAGKGNLLEILTNFRP